MRNSVIYIALALLLIGNLSAQDLTGIVVNEKAELMTGATVVTLNKADSTFVSFGLTNDKGEFKLSASTDQPDLILQVSFLGYKQYNKDIKVLAEDQELEKIVLVSESKTIEEVIVEGERIPIQVTDDTITYDANAFKVQPNDVVEDLLRKMPGIEVEQDGTIIAQGEEVQSVLVDGKEFFGKDPKIATKNLPAEAIDKVEVYDKLSDKAEFSGIDDGEREKTMNLELKESHKKGRFGKLSAGYGSENRRDLSGNLNSFGKKSQLSFLGNHNNINRQGFSVGEYMGFLNGSGRGFRSLRNSDLPIAQGLSNGFVETTAGGINFNTEFSDKIDFQSSYFVTNIDEIVDAYSQVENFGGNRRNFFETDSSSRKSASLDHRISAKLEIEIDSSQELTLGTTMRLTNSDLASSTLSEITSNNILQSESSGDYEFNSDKLTIGGSLLYRKKIGKRKRIFTLGAELNDVSDDLIELPDSESTFYDRGTELPLFIAQRQLQETGENYYKLEGSFVEPLGQARFLELTASRQNYDDAVVREVFDLLIGNELLLDSLSTVYDRTYTYDQLKLAYHKNWEATELTLEGGIQHSQLQNIVEQVPNLNRDNYNFIPRLSLSHSTPKGRRIRFTYRGTVREPSVNQLQPIVDNSDPQSQYIGNLDLINEFRHNARLNLISYDQFSFRGIFAFLTMTVTENKIVNQSFIDPLFREVVKPVNVDRELSLSANVTFSGPIKKLNMKYRLSPRWTYRNSIAFVNGQENDVVISGPSMNVTLENRKKEKFDISAGTFLSYNSTKYSESSNRSRSFLNQTHFANIGVFPSEWWKANTSLNLKIFDQDNVNTAEAVPIWNASLSRYFGEKKQFELSVNVVDILDRNNGISQTANINALSYQEVVTLGRYGMVTLVYALRGAGNSNSGNSRMRMFRG